ncbi:MAG: hypothetical protein LBN42_00600 [Oscillospiraceae bacterium]|jgi:hypothetical protein|nr:hypothetical protein [Oscillospiraceae bacterium]
MPIPLLLISLLIIYFILLRQTHTIHETQRRIIKLKQHQKQGATEMNETIKQFTNKDVIIHTLNTAIVGTVKSVEDKWVVLENDRGERDIISIDYISRIRDYPRNKSGKKKAVVT